VPHGSWQTVVCGVIVGLSYDEYGVVDFIVGGKGGERRLCDHSFYKYAMFDEVARERGAWDDLCVEPQVRALVGRGFCKPCKKFYDGNKGLEAHQKRRHPRPPVPSEERDADGEREA